MSETQIESAPQNILLFKRGPHQPRIRPEVELHAGRILFFTGVRYERMQDEAAVSGPDGGPCSDDGASRKKRRRA